jgi:hypothetical protein
VSDLKHADTLLWYIARGLQELGGDPKLGTVEVRFYFNVNAEGPVLVCDLATALSYIADDIYWDGESNWSEATYATVRVI